MSVKRERAKGRRTSRPFLSLPLDMLEHPAFASLSPAATKLLLDIALKYRGTNNGVLDAPYGELIRLRHWGSRTTISRALGELQKTGFLLRTRKGRRYGGVPEPSLYAISWQPIPASNKHTCVKQIAPRSWLHQNAGPNGGLDRPNQVQNMDLQRRISAIRRPDSLGFTSTPSTTSSPYSGPSLNNLSICQEMMIRRYCFFHVALHEEASRQ